LYSVQKTGESVKTTKEIEKSIGGPNEHVNHQTTKIRYVLEPTNPR